MNSFFKKLIGLANSGSSGAPVEYRVVEASMFTTCTMKCGYCTLAETGQVLDQNQLKPFRDPAFIKKVTDFFNSRTTNKQKWLVTLTGGEPLIAPNLDLLCKNLFEHGNRVAFYSSLYVNEEHPGFKFLLEHAAPDVDYIMAAFHPEAELDEDRFFSKVASLRSAGHNIMVKVVAHPDRLPKLNHFSERCKELDVCFYPATIFTKRYPAAYTDEERSTLSAHFTTLSQYIQLEGGLDTSTTRCTAGSDMIAVDLQSGNVIPCILTTGPSLGNVFTNTLNLLPGAISCPAKGKENCSCEINFQQNIVTDANDRDYFEAAKKHFVPPRDLTDQVEDMSKAGLRFYGVPQSSLGLVTDDSKLFYTADEVRANRQLALSAASQDEPKIVP